MFQSSVTRILSVVLFVIVGAYLLFRWLRPPTGVPALSPSASLTEEFRRRRRRCLTYGFPGLLLGVVMLAVSLKLFTRASFPGIAGSNGFAVAVAVAGFVAFGAGLGYLEAVYRCPACDCPVRDSEGGLPFFPDSCARCGLKF